MRPELDTTRPLFLQVKEAIEEDILTGALKPDEQIPSNSQLVTYYGINPVTVHKGVSLLLEDGTIYKKRGLGMFVSAQAPKQLRKKYQERFYEEYLQPLMRRAQLLGLGSDELIRMMREEQR